jgi:HEAT repeat protein
MAALGPEATPVLIQLLNQGGDDVRWWAVRTLGAITADEAGQALSLALSDPEPSVRQAAALGLCGRPLEGAVLESLARSVEDPDPLAGRLAAEALAGAGPAAIPFLQAALLSRRPSVRLHAVRGLVALGSPDAVPALISALDDASPQVVHWAEEGLEQLGLGMVLFNP